MKGLKHPAASGRGARAVAVGVFIGGGVLAIAPLHAQQPAQETPDEVLVTGSRIRQNGFESATPTTVVGSELLQSMGIVNVGDAVGLVPQNSQFVSDTNVGNGNFNVGAQLANLRGLNPFFGARTLTLIDSRRHVPTTTGGAVDLSLIPSILVSRIETVTGGASAAYGSDAIAGVVNVLLDTKLSGVKFAVDYGQTGKGDGDDTHIGVGGGWAFANGKGHVVIGGEYQDTGAVASCKARSWCANADDLFTNTNYVTSPGFPPFVPPSVANGFPHYVRGSNSKLTGSTQTGVLGGSGGGVGTLMFNDAGTALLPFSRGQFAGPNGNRQGGDGSNIGPYEYRELRPANTRSSVLGHLTYDFTDRLEGFVEVSYAKTDAVSKSELQSRGPNAAGGPASTIYADNFYLNQLVAPPVVGPAGIGFTREASNLRQGLNETGDDVRRIALGLSGDLFESGNWKWDAYYQYGRNENSQRVHNFLVNNFATKGGPPGPFNPVGTNDYFDWALDAVNDGTGKAVCRQVLLGNPAAAGCAPLNLFGLNNASQAALDYVYRTLVEDGTFKQQVVAATFQGTLAKGWGAGPLTMAAGVEYRKEQGAVTHGNDVFRLQFQPSYGGDFSGDLAVTEEFVEFSIPVVSGAQKLAFDVAARATSNEAMAGDTGVSASIGKSRTQDFSSWKVSTIYDPVKWFRLRGTRSQDVRAAAFRELYYSYDGTLAAQFPINNPWTGNPFDFVKDVLGGDFALRPEVADTQTFGFVFSPGGPTGMHFSADWYQIKLKDAINSLPFLFASYVSGCFANASSPSCAKITGTPNGTGGFTDIDTIYDLAANLGQVTTRGVDLEGSYTWSFKSGNALSLRVLATDLYDMTVDTGTGARPLNYAGQSGPVGAFGGFNTSPNWQGNVFLSYMHNRFSGTLQTQYVGSGRFATAFNTAAGQVLAIGPGDPGYSPTLPGSVSDNTVPGRTYLHLSGSYDFHLASSTLQLFGVINNLLDKDPPIASGGNSFPTNPVYFDTLGRTFRLGVRMQF